MVGLLSGGFKKKGKTERGRKRVGGGIFNYSQLLSNSRKFDRRIGEDQRIPFSVK
jgi:hypothetical protein